MGTSKFNDPSGCYKQQNLDKYMHHHLLSAVNDKYLANFQSNDLSAVNVFGKKEFDSYQCIDNFQGNPTEENKKSWRWNPCHIDSVSYNQKKVRKGTFVQFQVGIFLQQMYAHSSSCDNHIRCEAMVNVKSWDKENPVIRSIECKAHERIMSYADAKIWRDNAEKA